MDSHHTYLLFTIDDSTFAIAAQGVREVVRAVAITDLPGAPAVVEGVINVRGTIVPVMNTRQRFGKLARPVAPTDQLVLCWTGDRLIALRVDTTEGLRILGPEVIASADRISAGVHHIEGVARTADGVILIHNLSRFLDQAEAITVEGALSAAYSTS